MRNVRKKSEIDSFKGLEAKIIIKKIWLSVF